MKTMNYTIKWCRFNMRENYTCCTVTKKKKNSENEKRQPQFFRFPFFQLENFSSHLFLCLSTWNWVSFGPSISFSFGQPFSSSTNLIRSYCFFFVALSHQHFDGLFISKRLEMHWNRRKRIQNTFTEEKSTLKLNPQQMTVYSIYR